MFFWKMVHRAVDVVEHSRHLALSDIPDLPDYITDGTKPSEELVVRQLSRFNSTI